MTAGGTGTEARTDTLGLAKVSIYPIVPGFLLLASSLSQQATSRELPQTQVLRSPGSPFFNYPPCCFLSR